MTGLEDLQKGFAKALDKIETYSARALCDVVLDLLRKSVEKAPVKEGTLRGGAFARIKGVVVGQVVKNEDPTPSFIVNRPNFKAKNLEGEVSFEEPYALIQHEKVNFKHSKGGEAKFLEKAFQQNMQRFIKHLSDSVKKAVDDV